MSRNRCASESHVGRVGASIHWCAGCGNVHLSLGFVQISLTTDQFTHFHSLLNEAMQQIVRQQAQRQESGDGNTELPLRFH